MKCLFIFNLCFLLVFSGNLSSADDKKTDIAGNPLNPVKIQSTPEIYSLISTLISEYQKTNPEIKIDLSPLLFNEALPEDHIFFSSDESSELFEKTSWKMVIGKNAVIPVINAKNPLLEKILLRGFSFGDFNQLLTGKQDWKNSFNSAENADFKIYVSENEEVISRIADFVQTNPEEMKKLVVLENGEIVASVKNNLYSVGFCTLNDIMDFSTGQFIPGIVPIPIDKNRNGRIDSFEKIYSSPEALTRGIWIGKYPTALTGNVYAISSSKPVDRNKLDFLAWVQNEGQKYLDKKGFGELAGIGRRNNTEVLASELSLEEISSKTGSINRILIPVILVLAAIIAGILYRISRMKRYDIPANGFEEIPAMKESSLTAPKGLYYDKSHTWAFMEKEGTVRIGIDDFLQHITGELTRVTMKEPGTIVRKGEKMLSVSHNGKKLDIHAPVSGTIKERNRNLLFDSTLLNTSPYDEGWIYTIEPRSWAKENHFLLMSDKYIEWIGAEMTRLKDFFASALKTHSHEFPHTILQDGGEISDNVLADLDPEVWEDFQAKFIDTSK